MELSNYLVSWVVTYLGDLQPTYIGVIIYLLSSMDILVNQPIWKTQVKLNHFPKDRGENKNRSETTPPRLPHHNTANRLVCFFFFFLESLGES